MIRFLILFALTPMLLLAEDKVAIPAYAIVALFLVVIVLFFWGIYKAMKTQKRVYTLALLPFVGLIAWMFFI
jgi:hypothetical protein